MLMFFPPDYQWVMPEGSQAVSENGGKSGWDWETVRAEGAHSVWKPRLERPSRTGAPGWALGTMKREEDPHLLTMWA